MNRYLVTMAVMLAWAVVLASSPAGARPLAGVTGPAGGWGQAKEVPGTAMLNIGGRAGIVSVACGSAGNCSAGGDYADSSGNEQAFVVSQVHGIWGKAEEVPGTATLNIGGDAVVVSVSCASAGNCTAGGYYDSSGQQAFVVSQVHGIWGKAQEVPGIATLNTGSAQVLSVSCASAGNCAAGGWYLDGSGNQQAFVVSQVNGIWGEAEEVPGIAALNVAGVAQLTSVSCSSAGNCGAGGYYATSYNPQTGVLTAQAFVVSQVNGTWRRAKEVPGTATLNTGAPGATINSVSCASAGHCSAGGSYTDSSGNEQAFVVSRVNGTQQAGAIGRDV